MTEYRVGSHWLTTIVRVGQAEPDERGRRADDRLAGVVMDGAFLTSDQALAGRVRLMRRTGEEPRLDDAVLAQRICDLLNTTKETERP